MPKSLHRWVTSLSVSSKVPSSNRNSIRSRADILPSLCWRSRRSGPPPASASESRRLSSSSFSSRFIGKDYRDDSRQLLVSLHSCPMPAFYFLQRNVCILSFLNRRQQLSALSLERGNGVQQSL